MPNPVPLTTIAPERVEALLDLAFGPDRHGRTAYRIREGVSALESLSFGWMLEDALVGSAQCWPVVLQDDTGKRHPLTMVGPVAVHPELQGKSIGQAMTNAICDVLDDREMSAMMIGDPEYYERFFDFRSGPAGDWTLPGPAESHRILLRAAAGTEWPQHGILGPDLLRSGD